MLAYSGGLDTSIILKWLQDTYNCEVVTFTADLGQVRMIACIIRKACIMRLACYELCPLTTALRAHAKDNDEDGWRS